MIKHILNNLNDKGIMIIRYVIKRIVFYVHSKNCNNSDLLGQEIIEYFSNIFIINAYLVLISN